jgi:hypothetical protein
VDIVDEMSDLENVRDTHAGRGERIRMSMLRFFSGWPVVLAMFLAAQPRELSAAPPETTEAFTAKPDTSPTGTNNVQRIEPGREMESMAKSMSSMADMCRTMMAKEMSARPLKMAAAAVLGALLVLALVLFVVLEIQWIRYLGVRLRKEKASTKGVV